jgi:hypothetical protein
LRVTGETFCGGVELGADLTALEGTRLAIADSSEVKPASTLEAVGSVAHDTTLVLVLALKAIASCQVKPSLAPGTCGGIRATDAPDISASLALKGGVQKVPFITTAAIH